MTASSGDDQGVSPYKGITKRKLDHAIEQLDRASRPSTTGQTPPSTVKRPKSSTPALVALLAPTPPVPPTPPSYTPLSLPSLLARIATFRLSTYSPHPTTLSPAQLALHGWTNSSPPRDRVVCLTCNKALLVLGPSEPRKTWNSDVGRALEASYISKLRDGHAPWCPWNLRPASPTLYTLPPLSRSQLVQTPSLSLPPTATIVHPIPDEALVSLPPLTPERILAIFNWTPSSPPGDELLVHCDFCARRAYLSSSEGAKPFDALAQHMDFCAVLRGWETRVHALMGHSHIGARTGGTTGARPETGDVVEYIRGVLGPKRRSIGRGVP